MKKWEQEDKRESKKKNKKIYNYNYTIKNLQYIQNKYA